MAVTLKEDENSVNIAYLAWTLSKIVQILSIILIKSGNNRDKEVDHKYADKYKALHDISFSGGQ